MGKASRRPESSKAPPKSSDAAKAKATDKDPSQSTRWASSIAWLIVLAFSLVYHYANERLVAQRELPVKSDLFVVSYPKSGNFWMRFLLAHTWLYSQPGESNWHREIDFNSIERTIPDLEYGPNRREYYKHDSFRAFKSHQPFAPDGVAGSCAETVGAMDDFQWQFFL
eukprot:g5529.t1